MKYFLTILYFALNRSFLYHWFAEIISYIFIGDNWKMPYKLLPPITSLILQYINLSSSLSSSKWLGSQPGLLSLFSAESCSMKAFVCLRKGFPDTGVGLILLEGALVNSVDPSCWTALTVVKLILRDFVIGLDFTARGVLSKFGEFLKIIFVRLPLSPARSCILWKKKSKWH